MFPNFTDFLLFVAHIFVYFVFVNVKIALMAKCFFCCNETAVSPSPAPSSPVPSYVLTCKVSFICTFLPCQWWVSRSKGRKGVSPVECCVLSQTCWIHPHPPILLSLVLLLPLLGLWCVSAVCLGKCCCEGNTMQNSPAPVIQPQHRNMPSDNKPPIIPTSNPMESSY